MVGDDGVGKTCLLISFAKNRFPTEHVPPVIDNYAVHVMSGGELYLVGFFDSIGHKDYDGYTFLSFYISILWLIYSCIY